MEMADLLEDCAKVFSTRRHDLVMFGCTRSPHRRTGLDQECIRPHRAPSGALPPHPPARCADGGLRPPGVGKVAAITPYPDDTNAIEKQFLESHGIGVTGIRGMHQTEKSIATSSPASCTRR